jgi:hypothetical protein
MGKTFANYIPDRVLFILGKYWDLNTGLHTLSGALALEPSLQPTDKVLICKIYKDFTQFNSKNKPVEK